MISPQASVEKPPMQVVHMAATELTALDNLQGGPSIDEDTGLREYSALYPAFENESFKDIFRKTAKQLESKGHLDSQYESLYKMGKKPSHYEETPAEHDPEIHAMEEKGEYPDRHMALLPINAVKLFLEIEPEVHIGEDGILEFGKWYKKPGKIFKSAVRVGATVAGAVLGAPLGPIGAPIGAGLANMAAGALTGKKIDKNMLMSGLTSGLLTAGAQGLAGAGLVPDSVMNALPKSVSSMLLPSSTGPINLIPESVRNAGASGAGGAGGISGILGNLFGGGGQGSGNGSMNMMLPMALSGLMSYQGEKRHQKNIEKQREDSKREREEALQSSGYYDRASFMEPYKEHEWVENPDYSVGEGGEHPHGPPVWWREKKAKGGLIKGPGDGQADKIETTVPEGSYIIDASSVSDFGNGSSEMGGKVLQNMVNEVMRHSSSHHKSGGRTRPVPVYLSNDEFTIPPHVVSALGGGNNNIGAKQLRRMVKEIRIHKASKPKGLPPKAKSPFAYMEGR